MTVFRALPWLCTCAVFAACSSSSSPDTSSSDAGTSDGGTPLVDAAGADGSAGGDAGGGDGGGTTDAGLGWTSGTRLRAVVQTAGTARFFQGWHDTTLGVDCTYGIASDKTTRCLPSTGSSNLFDDDKCTSPIIDVAQGQSAPKYVPAPPTAPAPACGTGPDLYTVGATTTTPAALFNWNGTSCVAATELPDAAHTYYRPGAKAAPTSFVGKTDSIDPRGARISAQVWVGDDGSRQDGALLDKNRASAVCSATENVFQSGQYYCVPRALAYIEDFFSEGTCMTNAAFYPTYAAPFCNTPATAILDSTTSSIGKPLSLFEPGALLTGQIFTGTPASCSMFETPATTSTSFYAQGAALPLASLLAFTMKNEGSGRILDKVARTESGALGSVIAFYDTGKSTPCAKQLANDGQQRCLPQTGYVINLYADSSCSQALLEVAMGSAPPAAGTFLEGIAPLTPTVTATAVFQLGAKGAAPAMTWQYNGTTCTPGAVNATSDYYTTTAVPATDLALVTTAPE